MVYDYKLKYLIAENPNLSVFYRNLFMLLSSFCTLATGCTNCHPFELSPLCIVQCMLSNEYSLSNQYIDVTV